MAETPDNQPRTDAQPENPDPSAPSAGDASPTAKAGDSEATSAEQLAEQSMESVEKAANDIKAAANDSGEAETFDLPDFATAVIDDSAEGAALGMLNEIDLHVKVELGRTRMYIQDVLKLNENSIVELDKAAGDPVDIYVNDRHVARGEVLVLSENFCVRVSEIIAQPEQDE